MTTFTAASMVAVDTRQFDVNVSLSAGTSNRSSSAFDVDVGGGSVFHFTGANLAFTSGGGLLSGTLTGLSETSFGNTIVSFSSFSIDAASWVQWAHDHNDAAALAALFGGDDSITGGDKADYLDGTTGHDIILGLGGADTIVGGEGNEHLYGASPNGGIDGADLINAGAGSDYVQGNAGNDTLNGGDGSDRINGGKDDDLITGGSGNDSINGNIGNDTIDGGADNDFIRGGKDQDSLSGGVGSDTLMGDLGNDVLIGGAGLDVLTGGDGSDSFKFAGNDAQNVSGGTDIITDFTDGVDKIALGFTVTAVLTGSAQSSLSAAMTTAQQLADGHGGNGEVVALSVGSDTYLFYASDGGATVNSAVDLKAAAISAFDTTDFV